MYCFFHLLDRVNYYYFQTEKDYSKLCERSKIHFFGQGNNRVTWILRTTIFRHKIVCGSNHQKMIRLGFCGFSVIFPQRQSSRCVDTTYSIDGTFLLAKLFIFIIYHLATFSCPRTHQVGCFRTHIFSQPRFSVPLFFPTPGPSGNEWSGRTQMADAVRDWVLLWSTAWEFGTAGLQDR